MYTKEVEVIPEKVIKSYENIIGFVVCDLCGIKSQASRGLDNITHKDWQEGIAEVKLEVFTSYFDETDTDLLEFNICPDCFIKKLVPFIKDNCPHSDKITFDI